MKLFGKKYPPRAQLKLAEELTFVHGEEGGKALVARFNVKAKALVGHPEFTHRVEVAVVLNSPAANGLTQDEENTRLRDIEAQIRQCLEAENESLSVGAITTNGRKSYIFYTANPDGVTAKINGVRERIPSHKIRLTVEPDAAWNFYKRYVK